MISLIITLCLETLWSNSHHINVFIFAYFPQSNYQILKIPKTVASCCVTNTSERGSSSSEGNSCRLWILQCNQLPSFHAHLFKFLWPHLKDEVTMIFSSKIKVTHCIPSRAKKRLTLKKTSKFWLLFLLRLSLIHPHKLKFVQNMENSVTLTTS